MYPAKIEDLICFLQCEIFSQFAVERKRVQSPDLWVFDLCNHENPPAILIKLPKCQWLETKDRQIS
jgi:hypothetical protein